MSKDESEEFPVLKDVVKRGDEDVIKTARLEKEIFEDLVLYSGRMFMSVVMHIPS